jgi:predicted phage terminase large subunit-like protein
VGGTLTGRGADLIIIDDPLNANEALSEPARKRVIDWYGGALVSRLNDKETGAIIAVMQRLHEEDLAGHLMQQGSWSHLNLPAIAIEQEVIALGREKVQVRRPGDVLHSQRESRAALDAIRSEIGSLLFSAQYQQQPVPLEGNLIRRGWFRWYDQLPPRGYPTRVIQSWDVAILTGSQHDYSVCTTWLIHGSDIYLVHVSRSRLEYPDLRRKVIALAQEHRATTILIEEAGPGLQLLQDLRFNLPKGMTRPIGIKPSGTKVERMAVPSAKIEAGHVHLPHEAAWLDEFLMEVLSFPNARRDDQVDSLSQFINWAQQDAYSHPCSFAAPIIVYG